MHENVNNGYGKFDHRGTLTKVMFIMSDYLRGDSHNYRSTEHHLGTC